MKIRTESELFNKVDEELSWRKADLTRLRALILKNENTLVSQTLLRAAVPIIYAHWEGFIKETSIAYLNFLSIRGLKFSEQSTGILALHIKANYFTKSSLHSEFERAVQLIDFIENQISSRSNLKSIPNAINTKSNLDSKVLMEITQIFDIDYSKFEAYSTFIDSQLLDARNGIAHGEYKKIDNDTYQQLHDIVLKLITIFKDEIENKVVLKEYMRKKPFP